MSFITQAQVKNAMECSPDPEMVKLRSDATIIQAVTAVLNATLDIAADFPMTKAQLAYALSNKGAALAGLASTVSNSEGLQQAQFMASQTLKTIGLTKIAGLSPAKATAYITLTMAEKVVSAAGLGSFDKCNMAIASLATTASMGTLICVGTVGIGCFAGALAVAADAFNVYAQCRAK